jgi:hypothetical protein
MQKAKKLKKCCIDCSLLCFIAFVLFFVFSGLGIGFGFVMSSCDPINFIFNLFYIVIACVTSYFIVRRVVFLVISSAMIVVLSVSYYGICGVLASVATQGYILVCFGMFYWSLVYDR